MSRGREARDIETDFRQDHVCRQEVDPGNLADFTARGAKESLTGALALFVDPADGGVDLLVQCSDRFGQGVILCEMQAEPEPVVIGHPPMERVIELFGSRLDSSIRQISERSRTAHACDDRLDHPPAGKAHDVADDGIQLDVGFFERLLQALDMPRLLARHLLARALQGSQLLELLARDEAAANQAAGQQIGDPVASLTSVFLPGTFLMWAAFATINSKAPSLKMFQTGFQ